MLRNLPHANQVVKLYTNTITLPVPTDPSPAAWVLASSSSACVLTLLRPSSSLDSSDRVSLLSCSCSWILGVRPWRELGVCMRLRRRPRLSLMRVILSFSCKYMTCVFVIAGAGLFISIWRHPSILTCVNRGKDSSSRLAVSLTRSLMALCCSSASVAFRQNSSPWTGFSSDRRFATEHKRAIKGRCSAIDSLRPLTEEM